MHDDRDNKVMKPRLLIATADTDLARTFERFFSERGHHVVGAPTVREALSLIDDESPCCGAIVDLTFPDGNASTVLRAFHAQRPKALTLRVIPIVDRGVVNQGFIDSGGGYLAVKPVPDDVLVAFARWLADAYGSAVAQAAVDVGREHGFTGAETFLLIVSMRGVSRDELPTRLELPDSAVVEQVLSVGRKCGDVPFVDVVRAAREQAERLAGWTKTSPNALTPA